MFDALRSGDKSGIAHFVFRVHFDHFRTFFDQAFHAFALRAASTLFVAFQDLLQPIDVFFCLVEMQSKAIGQAFIGGSLGHFWKCFGQLLFGAVKVFQLVNVEIFQCFKFHSEGISNLGDDLDLFFVKRGVESSSDFYLRRGFGVFAGMIARQIYNVFTSYQL